MPWSLKKSLNLIGRGQEPLSFSLASSPILCKSTSCVTDLNTKFILSDRTEEEARWFQFEHDRNSEECMKEQAELCLPCCHHTQDNHPGMNDGPLDEKARHALEAYSNPFDEYRFLKRRLSTLTHSPRSDEAA
ncbi:hypothetical protein BO94DRAFT_532859 [Aspergillus sclerotioniger CBS 115572]|uniref:Uncharacterized protein n=1 Tax=Aspergillus sclerotioniger CBS 115572 TaxID=1450535 RepID=A0A317X401_9EURO|nr:hypothetical protein BO94DRAFT_532859 [Aspergillus sclerotioniger CBS 115572]PWY93075.1 hypothetical protein BO94DRAFT_532859 [Aspergillus sclerotioniger CBS 115572]